MFLQSLGKYLWRKAELAEVDGMYAYGQAALLHYVRWMTDHEYPYLDKPERLEFPTETWAAHEVRKSDVFCMAALHGDESERDRFLERGQFFFHSAISTLQKMPTRTLARPVIVLLSSGLVWPWQRRHPNYIFPAAPATEPVSRPPFVPQRRLAIARLKLIAFAVVLCCLLALGAILLFW
jgi:hypothetical protein